MADSFSIRRNRIFLLLRPLFEKTGNGGDIAQSVEQRTENPCVAGSIPAVTTSSKPSANSGGLLFYKTAGNEFLIQKKGVDWPEG
jgi:hypothetical protein